jgi:hypothetical protein
LRAALDEYGVPVEQRAVVRIDTTKPDGSSIVLDTTDIGAGVYEATLTAALPGVYRFHMIATGVTFRGEPFTREQLLTGAVFPGGDQPLPTGSASGTESKLCCLLGCLLKEKCVKAFLERHLLDPDQLQHCIEKCCDPKKAK